MLHVLKTIPIAWAVSAAAAGDPTYPPPQALALVDIALDRNPALASARLTAEAAHAQGEHHRAWPAPEASVDFFQAPVSGFPNPLKDQREIDYSLSQSIPFPGKPGAMSRPEHLRGSAEEKRAEAASLRLRAQVLEAYATLYAAERRLRLIREGRTEAGKLLAAARAGYEGGLGNQSDLLRAETEGAALGSEEWEATFGQKESQAMLAALLGRPDENVAGETDSIFPVRPARSLDSLKEDAFSRRADLEAMRLEVSMADAEIDAARKGAWPDLMVRGSYKDMVDQSRDYWSFMVGMQVPMPWSWKGTRENVRRTGVIRQKSERDYVSMRLMIGAEVERAFAALESAWGRMELARDRRIPLAQRASGSTLTAYQGGKAGFNEVLMASRDLRAARKDYYEAIADHLKAWAALEWATGGEIRTTLTSTQGETK